jgi:hypothetical protein
VKLDDDKLSFFRGLYVQRFANLTDLLHKVQAAGNDVGHHDQIIGNFRDLAIENIDTRGKLEAYCK